MNTFINTTVYWHSVTYCVGRHLNRAHGRDRVLTATSSLARSLRPPLAATSTLASARWREATTFNVITTQHVTDGAEFLANYVHGFARPHSACFENLFSQKCKCCACTQRTVHCAPWQIRPGPHYKVCERLYKVYVVFWCCKSSLTSWHSGIANVY